MASLTPSDEILVQKAVQGDARAYEILFGRYKSRVEGLALAMGCLEEDARGVCQGVFIQVLRNLPSFRGDSNFSTWLFAIARNRTLNWLRKSRRWRADPIDLEVEDNHTSNPEEMAVLSEKNLRVHMALNSMDPKYRDALVMFHMENRSYEEIAREMHVKVRTVETRLYRARQIFRRSLASVSPPHATTLAS